MTMKELDSFIFKFKNLCSSGRNANLNMKCGSGKIEVHLSVELHEAHADQPLRPQARNGLARQRRREKRAAAREIAAAAEAIMEKAGAVEEPVAKPSDKEIVAEKVTLREATSDGSDATAKEAIENETGEFEEICDEFCPDEDFYNDVDKPMEESSDVFKINFKDYTKTKPPEKNDNQILKEMERNLDFTFNHYKVRNENRNFKVIKSERRADSFEVLIKVDNIPEVIQAVRGLRTWITDVRKLSKRRTVPSSLPSW